MKQQNSPTNSETIIPTPETPDTGGCLQKTRNFFAKNALWASMIAGGVMCAPEVFVDQFPYYSSIWPWEDANKHSRFDVAEIRCEEGPYYFTDRTVDHIAAARIDMMRSDLNKRLAELGVEEKIDFDPENLIFCDRITPGLGAEVFPLKKPNIITFDNEERHDYNAEFKARALNRKQGVSLEPSQHYLQSDEWFNPYTDTGQRNTLMLRHELVHYAQMDGDRLGDKTYSWRDEVSADVIAGITAEELRTIYIALRRTWWDLLVELAKTKKDLPEDIILKQVFDNNNTEIEFDHEFLEYLFEDVELPPIDKSELFDLLIEGSNDELIEYTYHLLDDPDNAESWGKIFGGESADSLKSQFGQLVIYNNGKKIEKKGIPSYVPKYLGYAGAILFGLSLMGLVRKRWLRKN